MVFRSLEPGCCLQLIQHCIGKLGISVLGTSDLCCPILEELLDLFAQLASFRSGVMDGHPNVGQDDFWRGVQKCALNPDIDISISVTEPTFFVCKMVLEKQQRKLALCPGGSTGLPTTYVSRFSIEQDKIEACCFVLADL